MRKLIGIGVGPGAEDLITLRALRYLERADHIFVPRNKGKTRAYDIVKDFIDERKSCISRISHGGRYKRNLRRFRAIN